jgi:hypothetical protein
MPWLISLLVLCADPVTAESPRHAAELIFPLHAQHNHAPGVVECPNGDLFVSWYRGSGERRADDVAVFGAWKAKGDSKWSEPHQASTLIGGAVGLCVLSVLQFGVPWHGLKIAFPWLALIGATTMFASGYLVALIRPQQGAAP